MSQPWHGSMVNMLRVLINDNTYEGTYTYSDTRLIEVLTVAAMYVTQEITFTTSYTIDVVNCSITPDPYTNLDKVFQNMVVLKAACIVDQGVFREKALLSGLIARCGPATMQTSGYLAGFKDILNMGPCAMYQKLKEEYQFSGEALSNLIHFVLSPFVGNEFDPESAFATYQDTYRMVR